MKTAQTGENGRWWKIAAALLMPAASAFANLPLRDGLAKRIAHQDYAMLGDASSAAGGESVTLGILGPPPSPPARFHPADSLEQARGDEGS